ncbi:MAG TPA: SusC/RagA family TonB-linked outer membrane protein [Chitinophagaceae bacterium]|nr:SusC/RagA family TonB-linked outer membrane protein [Chitinophagaceae bacterium]
MQKRLLTLGLCREQSCRKLLMLMKLIAFFLLILCLQVSATGHSQKISIKISRVNLEKAFSLIEKQTSYRFVYNDDYLPQNKRIYVEAQEWTIEQILQEILADTKLGYRMMANNLVVIAPTGSENKDVTVTGKVSNSLGEPLSGVSIQLKNSSIGTTTNEKGEFEIKVPENAVLLFSFVGYINQEIILDGRTSVSLTLAAIDNTMNEVVVVGYGSQKKINVTGAVDQVSGKELAKRPIANIFQGLQGASPGLNIAYSGGKPGSTPSINIRGVGSIVNSSTPLIVIDGIAATTDDFLRLNPNDVGTITVLRDGASAAIYGARAAFGVILITTKQGASGGRQRISYNNYFSWSRRTVLPDMVTDPYIYSRVLETSTENTPWHYVQYSPYQYQWAKERSDNPSVEDTRIDPDDPNANTWIYMGNNNWNDYFFNKTSFSQNHSLSFSGGSEIGKGKPFGYLISTDYTKENGLNKLAKDDWSRYGLRARLNFTPINGLKFDNNLNVYQTITSSPSYSITDLYYLQPTQVAKNPDGTWANTEAGRLGAKLTNGGRYEQNRFGFQNIFKAVASFLNNDLQITGSASFKRELWKYNTDFKKYKIGYGPRDIREEGGSGSASVTNGSVKHDVYDLYANYTKRLGNDHEFKLLAGYNQEEYI